MDLSFYPLTLEAVDQAEAEALCLFVAEDERPLTGLAGLADWRLSGGLSRLLRKGLVNGTTGEALLTQGQRLGFKRLFIFGLGTSDQSETALAAKVGEALRRLQAAGVENAALQVPAKINPDLAIRTLIDETQAPARAQVFGADPAVLVRALSHAAQSKPGEARHERRTIKVHAPTHHGHASKPPQVIKVAQPHRQTQPEIPKASPLPFAPSGAGTGPAAPLAAASPAASSAAPPASPAVAPAAEAPPAGPDAAPGAGTTAALPDELIPVAPPVPDSDPPPAASAPASTTTAAPDPGSDSASGSGAHRSLGGKVPLPGDYKPQRFKPPEPKDDGGRKKKRRR